MRRKMTAPGPPTRAQRSWTQAARVAERCPELLASRAAVLVVRLCLLPLGLEVGGLGKECLPHVLRWPLLTSCPSKRANGPATSMS